MIQMLVYSLERDWLQDAAAAQTAYKMFDIGDDLGSITKFVLDFHVEEGLKPSEWSE